MYGLATDWPLEWDELERHYVEAERALNVAGEPSAYRGGPPVRALSAAAVPLSYNLQVLKGWAEQSGLRFNALPLARNLYAVRRPRRLLRLRHVRHLSRPARATHPTSRSSS